MRSIFLSLLSIFLSQLVYSQIVVTIVTPANNLVDTGFVTVRATVTPGEYEIASFIASIDNRSVSLINIGPYFQGNLSTSGLTIGNTYLLTITATDVMGNQGSFTKNVIVDPPPKINIQQPLNHEVATPQLHLKATANDNLDCNIVVSFHLSLANGGSASGVVDTFINSVDTIIYLSDPSYQGAYGTIRFKVTDSNGQVLERNRGIFIESSPYLERVFSSEGLITDFNYGKVLSYFETLTDGYKNGKIADVNTGAVWEIPSFINPPSCLTPTGAFLFTDSAVGSLVRDWNNDSLYRLGEATSSSSVVSGPYAIWSGGLFNQSSLYLRNTASRTTTLVSPAASHAKNSAASNGTVAYVGSDGFIYRYNAATNATTRITNSAGYGPLTDGKLIVYTRAGGIYLYANASYIPLSTYSSANPGEHYLVENGFTAYVKPGTLGQALIWLRDTTGINNQITFFSNSSTLDVLAPDGSLSFYRTNGSTPLKYLYDRNSNQAKVIASTRLAGMYYRDSLWYMTIGRALFKVKPDFINSYFSVSDGNWSNPATWYGNTVPPTGADVTVGNNVVVDVDATCNTLTVKSNAVVNVNTGINLLVLH